MLNRTPSSSKVWFSLMRNPAASNRFFSCAQAARSSTAASYASAWATARTGTGGRCEGCVSGRPRSRSRLALADRVVPRAALVGRELGRGDRLDTVLASRGVGLAGRPQRGRRWEWGALEGDEHARGRLVVDTDPEGCVGDGGQVRELGGVVGNCEVRRSTGQRAHGLCLVPSDVGELLVAVGRAGDRGIGRRTADGHRAGVGTRL